MELTDVVTEFIDELLGLHSAYALTDIEDLQGAADAEAFVRLRVRLCDALAAEGWHPSAEAAERLERDRLLLTEPHDDTGQVTPSQHEERAMIRAKAQRIRDEARRSSDAASQQRKATVDTREELAQMRQALESRAVIEQAKGIAMERYGLRAEVAWSWLVRTSQNRNVKVRVLAEELVAAVATAAQSEKSGGSTSRVSTPSS
jgi:hypothetical protein